MLPVCLTPRFGEEIFLCLAHVHSPRLAISSAASITGVSIAWSTTGAPTSWAYRSRIGKKVRRQWCPASVSAARYTGAAVVPTRTRLNSTDVGAGCGRRLSTSSSACHTRGTASHSGDVGASVMTTSVATRRAECTMPRSCSSGGVSMTAMSNRSGPTIPATPREGWCRLAVAIPNTGTVQSPSSAHRLRVPCGSLSIPATR